MTDVIFDVSILFTLGKVKVVCCTRHQTSDHDTARSDYNIRTQGQKQK